MKFIILTDSTGCPRISPKSEIIDLKETYPYLLKDNFVDAKFWQLSIGNQTSQLLINQARGYLLHWKPDFIILGTGINDVRLQAFTEKTTNKFFFEGKLNILNRLMRKFFYMPFLIKFFKRERVSEKEFIKSINSLKNTFKNSKIIWLEISCHNDYEKTRPGVLARKKLFNQKIKEIFQNGFLEMNEDINKKNFFTKDLHHFTKEGHKLIANKIIKLIHKLN